MKNLVEIVVAAAPSEGGVATPWFAPVTLQRPMRLFRSVLGLTPGRAGSPDPDFLVKLMTDHDGHQAWIRSELGVHYPNFLNAIRGRNVREPTKKAMARDVGIRLAQLEEFLSAAARKVAFPGGTQWKHVAPGVPAALMLLASVPARGYKIMTARDVLCPSCGANMLNDLDAWWSASPVRMGSSEYQFAERLLTSLALVDFIGIGPRLPSSLSRVRPSTHKVTGWLCCNWPSGPRTSTNCRLI